jgi:membrane-bound metal-dependent hydrolase YbcI (DUF457 family)
MLPDLDSNSGRPLREATAMGAAVVPMLMVERLQRLQISQDTMVLIAILTYVAIRFVLAEIFRRYTVHRGMWHSLPAAAICGCFAFMVMSNEDITVRLFKTLGVVLGFLSHLVLDEIWSVDFKKGSYKFKESFGTALKLWGNNRGANLFTYGKLAILSFAVWQDQGFMSRYNLDPNVPHSVSEMIASLKQRFQKASDAVENLGDRIGDRLQGEGLANQLPGDPAALDQSLVPGGSAFQPGRPAFQPSAQPSGAGTMNFSDGGGSFSPGTAPPNGFPVSTGASPPALPKLPGAGG